VLGALALMTAVLAALVRRQAVGEALGGRALHDLANLMLAFVLLWTYLAYDQYLIIWAGNLPEEVAWYAHRAGPGWRWVALALIAFHFAVPFLVLLSRRTKRSPRALMAVAIGLLVMRFVDYQWLITPALHPHGVHLHWVDAASLLAVGGLWLALFGWNLAQRALLPVRDDRFAGGVAATVEEVK
jgi:hypothetical protein